MASSLYNQMMGNQTTTTGEAAVNTNSQVFGKIKEMGQMLQNSVNPQRALNMLAQNNPQVGAVMNMLNSSRMSPKAMFYQMAKQYNVNPEQIISALK